MVEQTPEGTEIMNSAHNSHSLVSFRSLTPFGHTLTGKVDYPDQSCTGTVTITLEINTLGNAITTGFLTNPNLPPENYVFHPTPPGQQGPPFREPNLPGNYNPGNNTYSTTKTINLSCNNACCDVNEQGELTTRVGTPPGMNEAQRAGIPELAHEAVVEYHIVLKGGTADCKVTTDNTTVRAFFR